MKPRVAVLVILVAAVVGALTWGARRVVRANTVAIRSEVPTTHVKKGSVVISVAARGELQGGNSEMLTAPMVGGGDMSITVLRSPGEVVKAGDVVVQLDTTQQEFNQREAEADLAEAEQQLIQARATSQAVEEEAQYQIVATKAEVEFAGLEVRRNPVLEKIKARQNEIALEAAQNRARQAEQDYANKKSTTGATVAIQQAAKDKATVLAETARKNIEMMTLRAQSSGYVNVLQNTNQNMIFWGMMVPPFQVGDTTRAGMAVAQIPDMKNWEVSATVGELDRGHLSPEQKVTVGVVALAGKSFRGHVKAIGGTTGPPWDRKFEARIALDEVSPDLRPGMTSNMVITVETIDDVLWIPSQALFESDGRSFVYLQTPSGFMPHDVKLERRSESQTVLSGIQEGDIVAMSNPDQGAKAGAKGQPNSAMKALSR